VNAPSLSLRPAPTTSRRAVFAALGIDAVLVLVFVLIGRATHDNPLLGALVTLWPFLAGLAIGWAVCRGWRAPFRVVTTGVPVWMSTVLFGMLLRAASGQGVQPSFVIVTTLVLAAFLLGWRAIAGIVRRPRSAK
jgi:hypothetical protein